MEVIELELSPAEEARKAERRRARNREWQRNNRATVNRWKRLQYARTHQRSCPGTDANPLCSVDLTCTGQQRCDWCSYEHDLELRRARRENGAEN
jgi:hypothetical protein